MWSVTSVGTTLATAAVAITHCVNVIEGLPHLEQADADAPQLLLGRFDLEVLTAQFTGQPVPMLRLRLTGFPMPPRAE